MIFGALASNYSPAAFIGAIGLAIGIGIQNIPEGQPWLFQFVQTAHLGGKLLLGINVSNCRADCSSHRCFCGHFYDTYFTLCPLLCGRGHDFVVVEELIPESQTNGNTDIATLGLMAGFIIMMILDVALG